MIAFVVIPAGIDTTLAQRGDSFMQKFTFTVHFDGKERTFHGCTVDDGEVVVLLRGAAKVTIEVPFDAQAARLIEDLGRKKGGPRKRFVNK